LIVLFDERLLNRRFGRLQRQNGIVLRSIGRRRDDGEPSGLERIINLRLLAAIYRLIG